MLKPSRDDFRALARGHTVVPVWRELLADLSTPVSAFLRVVGDEPGFLGDAELALEGEVVGGLQLDRFSGHGHRRYFRSRG